MNYKKSSIIAHVEQNPKVVKNVRLMALLRSYVAAVAKVGRFFRFFSPTFATAATYERSSAIKRPFFTTLGFCSTCAIELG